MIYELYIDDCAVEKFFDRYYKRIKNKSAHSKSKPPKCNKQVPSIFLINRQIYNEAAGLISKKNIVFHHGMLGLSNITKVVSECLLQQVSSIIINVSGHKILQDNILRESWHGYMNILNQLSTLLSEGHKLKKLTIDLEDPDLIVHVTTCWDVGSNGPLGYKCDFRDHMTEAFEGLRSIRGVGQVTLKGFPACIAPDLKARMESKPIGFFDLPGEIRNMIYGYAANTSDVSTKLHNHMCSWLDRRLPMPDYPKKTTPTILLLNKRITSEALHVIRSKPLSINFSLYHELAKQPQVPFITGFVSEESLQQIEHLNLRLEKWEWVYSIESLVEALNVKHNLKSFHLYLRDSLKQKFMRGIGRYYPDKALHESVAGLKGIRGVGTVTIEGDLPEVYTVPLKKIMMSSKDEMVVPPKPMGVGVAGEVVDVEELTSRDA